MVKRIGLTAAMTIVGLNVWTGGPLLALWTPTVRQHTPWLRSMRGERPQYQGEQPTLTALERTLVAMVVIAFVAFEIWFFFFSSSPIDNRTGRSAVPHEVAHAAEPFDLALPRAFTWVEDSR